MLGVGTSNIHSGTEACLLKQNSGYLREVHEGDPARLDAIPIWLDLREKGRHVRRMLAAYCRWLHGTPEIAVMYLLGLAGRPVSIREVRGLADKILGSRRKGWFNRTPAPEFFLPLKKLSDAKYRSTCARLQELDLLIISPDGMLDPDPVVREYFFQQVRVRSPDALLVLQAEPAVEPIVSYNINHDMLLFAEMEKQLKADLMGKNWSSATVIANRLSRHQRLLGNIPEAVQYARQSAAYAVLCADQSVLRKSLEALLGLLQSTGDKSAAAMIRQKLAELDEYVQVEVVS